MWRARAYTAMSALRVLAALRAVDMAVVDSEDMLEIRRTLEKEVVRRLAFEPSAAVRKILQQGEAFAAEVSCDLWTTPLQNTANSYSQAAEEIKGDIRVTMQVRGPAAQPGITLFDTRTFDSLRRRLSCSRRGPARSSSMRATRTSSSSGLCCIVLQRRSSTPCTATWRRVDDAQTAKSFVHIIHHPVTTLSPCCI